MMKIENDYWHVRPSLVTIIKRKHVKIFFSFNHKKKKKKIFLTFFSFARNYEYNIILPDMDSDVGD